MTYFFESYDILKKLIRLLQITLTFRSSSGKVLVGGRKGRSLTLPEACNKITLYQSCGSRFGAVQHYVQTKTGSAYADDKT